MASLRRATSMVSQTHKLLFQADPPFLCGVAFSSISKFRLIKVSWSVWWLRERYCDEVIYRYLSTSAGEGFDVDFSNEESRRRLFNRLLYRSKQRGFLELDLVLGKWVDGAGIRSLVDVLDLENPDLWKWVSGQESPPEVVEKNPVFCAVRGKVLDNLNSYSAPDTRVVPGKTWVRGWDDIKRARDSPITGNQ